MLKGKKINQIRTGSPMLDAMLKEHVKREHFSEIVARPQAIFPSSIAMHVAVSVEKIQASRGANE